MSSYLVPQLSREPLTGERGVCGSKVVVNLSSSGSDREGGEGKGDVSEVS